jgi:hypothetical protein
MANNNVVITLTKAQAEALLVLADEGYQGICTDVNNVKGYLKGSTVAAENALKKLRQAIKEQ